MDFYRINERKGKDERIEIYPDFTVVRSKDLMVRGKQFYAIWDQERKLWSTDEYDVQRLVDAELLAKKAEMEASSGETVRVKLMHDFSTGVWRDFRSYMNHLSDSAHQLDENFTFRDDETTRSDYASRRLSYDLVEGELSGYEDIISTLYDPEERAKIEWAIGAVLSGDAKHIQKFIVFYGKGGTGKSTILNILMKLVEGYYITFDAKALTSQNNAFSTEVFKSNPLVAIQHDGDLSGIADNSKLNSIVAHEDMTMNEKYKPSYMARILAFLFMATNKPVKITDAKSGIIRRLIDVHPSGRLLTPRQYQAAMSQIDFELGAIAHHCLEVYRSMGKNFYADYEATEMRLQTDVFYNFIEEYFDVFKAQDGVTLKAAYSMYKIYCDESNIEYKLPQYKFREELRNYFENFQERAVIDDVRVTSWFSGFITERLNPPLIDEEEPQLPLVLESDESIFDKVAADRPAQYANENGTPVLYWKDVTTTLADLDTKRLHYVKPPEQEIVIDFDLKDETGEKSAELNLAAASQWPPTYAEFSQGGGGIHLHYNYVGDVSELGRIYSDGIEIKVFTGDSSLRRRFTRSNNVPVASLSSGLPLKEKKKVLTANQVMSEKGLRTQIVRNLNKEIHPGTKPSMDFMKKILDDAYASGLKYDLNDMRTDVFAFANNSSNQADYCIKLMKQMKFKSDEDAPARVEAPEEWTNPAYAPKHPAFQQDQRLVLFDVEVFRNLFVICWKYEGSSTVVRMLNPTPQEVEQLFKLKLVGFNNRKYDNHIIYGRFMGMDNEALYRLSKKIIKEKTGFFGEAYELSYADIYDFSSIKESLKKFEIRLGLPHKELSMPFDKEKYETQWDAPVPDDYIEKVIEYCVNDVDATDSVLQDRRQDLVARQILADLSGLTVNHSTLQHTSKIVFGDNRRPQSEFNYTDLSKEFPGYEFDSKKRVDKSTYKGEKINEGGFVYAEPGIYHNVALLDVQSMHPTTINILEMFGKYTPGFWELVEARLAIKHGDYDAASKMLDGKLAPHLGSKDDAKALSYALKIVINIVYGVTSAKFENPFRDPRNVDNIVAKRGSLFMVELKNAVQEQGFKVVHIKTDSIKIADATPEIIEFVMKFGEEYGYTFEHEKTFEKFALVNNAVYVGKSLPDSDEPAHWEATGAQFKHPYVFKTLFTNEPIEFRDMCEAKFVTSNLYMVDADAYSDSEEVSLEIGDDTDAAVYATSKQHFVGKAGLFVPVVEGAGGGLLMREKDGKMYAANNTTGYRWLEADVVERLHMEDKIDRSYFINLVNDAIENISQFGDFSQFRD
jgi:hypothetical protein